MLGTRFWMEWLALFSPSAAQKAADMPMIYLAMKQKKLYKFMMSMCLDGEALKSGKNSTLWNPIFNYAVNKLDRPDCDSGVSFCRSEKELLTKYLEKEKNVACSRAHAAKGGSAGLDSNCIQPG